MRTSPRNPRTVHPAVMVVLNPLFRHSMTRDAYVLRGVGHRLGPVLRPHRPNGSLLALALEYESRAARLAAPAQPVGQLQAGEHLQSALGAQGTLAGGGQSQP